MQTGPQVKLVSMRSRHSSLRVWRSLGVAICAALSCTLASAQWMWVDSSGNKVFSDTAPPPGTPEKNILRKPGLPRTEIKPADAPAATAEAPAPKPTGKDEQLEAKKKAAEKQAAEAAEAKKKAEAAKLAASRSENCERARRAKASIDSGMRIATVNAKGEREIMDDQARATELRRIEGVIRADCGPLPAVSAGPAN